MDAGWQAEKLSIQNNYAVNTTPVAQLLQRGHANQDAVRYEMRRSMGC